jgi:hypothetical protein
MSYRPQVPTVWRRANPVNVQPMPDVVGRLWYELAETFATGKLAAATEKPDLVELGEQLQIETTTLMDQVSQRLGLFPSADVETGFVATLAKGASKAWKWLSGTSKKVLQSANTNRAVLLGAAAIGATAVVTHDWLTEDEQVKREAITAKRTIAVEALKRMSPAELSTAFRKTVGSIDDTANPSSNFWLVTLGVLAVAGAAYVAGKRGRDDS